jgi:transcriptional regulator GlxA family with amidase domain
MAGTAAFTPSFTMTPPKPLRIALLAYTGCMGLEVFGIHDVLLTARHVANAIGRAPAQPIDVQLVSVQARRVTAAGGLVIQAQRPTGRFDWLIVPGLEVVQSSQWPAKLAGLGPELAFVRRSFAQGTQVASVCVGSFLLGEAGLLDDRQATTAWIMAKALAARYPNARVNASAIVLEDGAITTSGAMTATFDLALHLIKRTMGADVASATARVALLAPPRASQAPYVDPQLVAPAARTAPLSFSGSVAHWLAQRLQEPYDLSRLAQAFHVSPRTLMRRVKAETGQSPLTLLQQARVEEARRLLGHTNWSIQRIVEAVGYTDAATFSRLFVRETGITPARYRG